MRCSTQNRAHPDALIYASITSTSASAADAQEHHPFIHGVGGSEAPAYRGEKNDRMLPIPAIDIEQADISETRLTASCRLTDPLALSATGGVTPLVDPMAERGPLLVVSSGYSTSWAAKMLKFKTALFMLPPIFVLAGCASVPLREGGTLTSYNNLGEEKGFLSKSRNYVDTNALPTVKTVSIVPTTFTRSVLSRVTEAQDRALVANALNRELCVALSDKFQLVSPGERADLTVRAVVTDVQLTDKAVAGVATAVSLGSRAVLPVGVPRLPFGLGGLAVEGEAIDSRRVQRAAMVWARGANSITNNPRVSDVGDAYALASTFANDFSQMLAAGKEPQLLDISLPSIDRIRSSLGGEHKYAACETFGRTPGLAGLVAGKFGAPPEWTDEGSNAVSQ
jgi:hypothetical protein